MAEQKKEEQKKTKKVSGLRVIARRDGFRRGGRTWTGTTDVSLDEFSKEQLKQLKDESLLSVTPIEIEVADEGK